MPLNRQIQPAPFPIQTSAVPEVQPYVMGNGLPVYYLHSGIQEVLKIEFLYKAGFKTEKLKGVASVTGSMLFEGTQNFTAKEIHEELDQLGVFFETGTGLDHCSVSFFTLRKHLKKLLPLIKEIISQPVFPEKELKILITKRKKALKVNLKKNEFLAQRLFLATLLGREHPYTQELNDEDYDLISRNKVLSFYQENIFPENSVILVSGKTHPEDLKRVEEYFGLNAPLKSANTFSDAISFSNSTSKKNVLVKPKSIQASIRTGKILFTRNHPDYCGFKVLNEILGGYFGSRLMSNIREEKGYTYGIGSALFTTRDFGIFIVATDAKGEMSEKVLEEIYKEMDILRKEPVTLEELNRVKNYMQGAFLASLSSPFSQMDKFIALYESGLDYSFYRKYLEILKVITPGKIQELAIKYLEPATMKEVVVGPS